MNKVKKANEIIRERLRQAREAAGLSQAEAARFLHRPQWFVSRCETGYRRVDVGELVEFGEIYSQPLSYFIKDI